MWPYRPRSLSELLDPEEISALLAQGIDDRLGSDVALFVAEEDGSGRRFDPPAPPPSPSPGARARRPSPFCHFLRRGKIGGKLAFEGADTECARCEMRFAERVLSERAGGGAAPASGEIPQGRCHMGLHDLGAPVTVRGHLLGVVVAGQRVLADEDRTRIAKKVGKVGKLTRAEVRSIEESGEPAAPSIRPRDEKARELLQAEIREIPLLDDRFAIDLAGFAELVSRLAGGRYAGARSRWEDDVIERVVPEIVDVPFHRGDLLRWVQRTVRQLHRELGLRYVALFGRLPEALGAAAESLRLLAESGLSGEADTRVDLRGAEPVLELDPSGLPESARTLEECVENALGAASPLIGALRTTPASPPGWKDTLTKNVLVAAVRQPVGLEVAVVFGPPAPADGSRPLEPAREDLAFLWRAARRIAERYLLQAAEHGRRLASRSLARFEEAERARRPQGPIRPQRFDARKLLDSVLETVREKSESRRVTIDARALPERAMVEADRPQLALVFEYLLDYAVGIAKPDPEGTQPSVILSLRRSRRDSRRYAVSIDVVGRFLSSEERRRLFENGRRTTANGAVEDDGEREHILEGPMTFRKAQRVISWHHGRLSFESERVAEAPGEKPPPAGGSPAPPAAAPRRWTGRTVFTVEIPRRPLPKGRRDGPPRRSGSRRADAPPREDRPRAAPAGETV